MDLENGPLVYHPGSHRLPVPTWEEIGEALGEDRARGIRLVRRVHAARGRFSADFAKP